MPFWTPHFSVSDFTFWLDSTLKIKPRHHHLLYEQQIVASSKLPLVSAINASIRRHRGGYSLFHFF